jgi:ribonuclease BN (tRNA processing enzyme)
MTRDTVQRGPLPRVTFLGTGDAFGSGGRLQSALHVGDGAVNFLVDCGPAVLPAMRRSGLDPGSVDLILVSHLHGDHMGGIPFFLLEAQLSGKRDRPLSVAGPCGISRSVIVLLDALFPGFTPEGLAFPLEFIELTPGAARRMCGLSVTAFPAVHSPLSNPLSLRIETMSRTIAYSGDTEWHEGLVDAARGCDLFVCECFRYEGPVKNHLDHLTLTRNRHLIGARRIVLVHMDDSMLERLGELAFEPAEDGMVIEI